MRNFIRVTSVYFLLILLSTPVRAQFTVLPNTDKTYEECQAIIDQYVSTGIIPPADYGEKALENEKAQDAYKNAQKSLEDSQKVTSSITPDMIGACNLANNDPQDPNCAQIDKLTTEEAAAKIKADEANEDLAAAKEKADKAKADLSADQSASGGDRSNLLGCAVKTGRTSLQMAPYFITYFINFALGLVGLVALFFIVIGGYYYVLGGLSEDKDKGKNTIKNALMGMGIALLAWSAINVIIQAITS